MRAHSRRVSFPRFSLASFGDITEYISDPLLVPSLLPSLKEIWLSRFSSDFNLAALITRFPVSEMRVLLFFVGCLSSEILSCVRFTLGGTRIWHFSEASRVRKLTGALTGEIAPGRLAKPLFITQLRRLLKKWRRNSGFPGKKQRFHFQTGKTSTSQFSERFPRVLSSSHPDCRAINSWNRRAKMGWASPFVPKLFTLKSN